MATQVAPASLTIIRRGQVEAKTGLGRSAIYGKLRQNPKRPNEYDPTFPKPVHIGLKAVGWVESEVDGWLKAQIAKSRQEAPLAPEPKPPRKVRPLSLPTPVAILDGE